MHDEYPITIDCRGDRLMGIVHPAADGDLAVVFVVGGPQYRVGSHRMFVTLARALAKTGTAVLRFDCRGMGDSDGTFTSFEGISDDIRCAVDDVAVRMPERCIVLLGLCDGASACAAYAARDPRVRGLVLMNPWVRSETGEAKARVTHYYSDHLRSAEFWRRLFTGRVDMLPSIVSLVENLRLTFIPRPAPTPNFIDAMLNGLRAFLGPTLVLLSADDLTAQEFTILTRTSEDWGAVMTAPRVVVDTVAAADHTFSGPGQLEDATARVQEFVAARVDVRQLSSRHS